jgi:F0F1-type ATP synthase alpha subunit
MLFLLLLAVKFFLKKQLFNKGVLPAIDVVLSIGRIGPQCKQLYLKEICSIIKVTISPILGEELGADEILASTRNRINRGFITN